MITSSIFHNQEFWIVMAGLIPGVTLFVTSIRAIYNFLHHNRIDRLEMYVQLVDDLQEELKRPRRVC